MPSTIGKAPERPADALARLATVTQDAAVTLSSGVFTDAAEPFVDCAGSSLQQREGGRGRGCFAWDPADVRAFAGVVSYLIGASIVAVPPAELATAVIGSGLRATSGGAGRDGSAAAVVAACAPPGAATAPDGDGSSSSDGDE